VIRYKRRKVVGYKDRPHEFASWGLERCAVLECGHVLGMGRANGPVPEVVETKRHACVDCGPERAADNPSA
jgi:hypothetical protein